MSNGEIIAMVFTMYLIVAGIAWMIASESNVRRSFFVALVWPLAIAKICWQALDDL